ncbi:DNA sulfur modification protein DndB [Arthrobacter sp. SAFR-014]|uniref:DNA sulfur modification protein DndB n=1 Tax=unclassified Arthrobacter TaxID=235627 RepID=UPI003F7B7EF0
MSQIPDSDVTSTRTKRTVMFGRVALPGIGYKMGTRQMVTTVMSPVNFVGTVGGRENWDPLSGSGTNRKEDKAHREGIAKYIETTEDYVLNALLVYMGLEDAHFEPDDPEAPISPGILYVRPGAKFKVGDGGHRTSAYSDVIQAHQHGDDVLKRLTDNGQPVTVVLDDDPVRRAQDFTDLQNNAKPLNASIAQSMDRRQAINRLLIERVIKPSIVPVVANNRIEFLVDSPGKLSPKIMGFKTLRYATGTLLIGTGQRTTRGWEEAVNLALLKDEDGAYNEILEFWTGFSQIPPVVEALVTEKGVVLLREATWLTSANVIYAIAAAVHRASNSTGRSISQVMKPLDEIDFRRAGTTLIGTLVDEDSGKALAGREAWESAASEIAKRLESSFL